MCGISGYININNEPIRDTSRILDMLRVQKHRGPDDSGIRTFSLCNGNSMEMSVNEPSVVVGSFEGVLGFNRLSILDLSENGHQPMISPDDKVLLALNGEIYNAFDYSDELKDWGYRFKSTTDTEIVLALYLKYGLEGMLLRLNGMFAIVIVDLRDMTVYILRDRFGIKPMYYYFSDKILAFSSELKSFRYLKEIKFELKEDHLDEFLLFRNNLRGTLLQNVHSLTPGHYLIYDKNKGLNERSYFDIDRFSRSEKLNNGIDFYLSSLEKWLTKSVTSQLMSDVRLGCQLSGGIDSTLVTWLANKESAKGSFEGVSIIFKDHRFNEEEYIDIVTDKLGIRSHKFLLEADYFYENFGDATWHLEAPINHPNTLAIYRLSQQAKRYVTVLLSGEGADEVFGGYRRFYDINHPFRLNLLLREIKSNMANPWNFRHYFDLAYKIVMASSFMTPAIARSLKPDFRIDRAISGRRDLLHSLTGSVFDRQVKYEMSSYLPDLLTRQDKMSMAHSIENRVPFLDNELVENSFSIPYDYLLPDRSPEGNNTEKYLLKKLTSKTFGSNFAFLNKRGFGIPIREFLLNPGFNEYLSDTVLPNIKNRGIFNVKIISNWVDSIKGLKFNELEALWVVIAFEIWASIFLDENYEDRHSRY